MKESGVNSIDKLYAYLKEQFGCVDYFNLMLQDDMTWNLVVSMSIDNTNKYFHVCGPIVTYSFYKKTLNDCILAIIKNVKSGKKL